jgi:hypothetical protein
MIKQFTFLLCCLILPHFLSGQISPGYEVREVTNLYNSNKLIDGKWKVELTVNDIQGSPYLNDEFISGTIYTTQKQQYNNIPLRYNIYKDELEFRNPSNEVMVLTTPEIVEYAVFGENIIAYSSYQQGSKTKQGFFLVLESGKSTLMAKASIIFQQPTEPGAYKEPEPAKFIRRTDEYYIQIGKNALIEINNIKSLIEAFPDNSDKVEAFIEKNKIKTNKSESLIEVVKYYNSL